MVLTFFIVMFILLMQFLWMRIDMILGKGLPNSVIAELLMYVMIINIPIALPLATLLASIMTLGNMGEYNELLSLKAAGVSLQRIIRPLLILMVVICMGSFFVINNLTPFAWQQMVTLLNDFRNTKHEMKLQDGVFFNGFDNMSIRVSHHDQNTKKLTNVLIYSLRDPNKMQTVVADSGYLKMSNDRRYIILELYNGQVYEQNRNSEWYSKATLSHHIFDYQESYIPTDGFAFDRGDVDMFKNKGEAMNMSRLSFVIDSLKVVQDSLLNVFGNTVIRNYVFKRYMPYENIDSLPQLHEYSVIDRIDTMSVTNRNFVLAEAKRAATDARDYLKNEIENVRRPSVELYRAQENYQKKIALPFSIMIFFLIGAPLGAIIRKGGLGLPIVISVTFFVFYYIISISGDNLVRDGALPAIIGIWMSTAVLLPIAIFLTYKAANDSALFNTDSYISKFKKLKGFVSRLIKRNDKNS